MRKISQLVVAVGALGLSSSAAALQYTTWNFENVTPTINGTCGGVTNCQATFNLGSGLVMKARAYATSSTSTNSAKLGGAQIFRDTDTGLGVKSPTSGDNLYALDDTNRFDVMVFEAPTEDFNWKEIELGWRNDSNGNTDDMQAWVGNYGGQNYDFTQMCLGSGGACATNSIVSKYTSLGTFNDVVTNSGISLGGGTGTSTTSPKGRYLVVSGELSAGFADAFKIKSIKGAPEPQTFALLGIGLLAMAGLSRRKAVASA